MCLSSKPLRGDGFLTCDQDNACLIAGISFANFSHFTQCSTNAEFLDVLFDLFLVFSEPSIQLPFGLSVIVFVAIYAWKGTEYKARQVFWNGIFRHVE